MHLVDETLRTAVSNNKSLKISMDEIYSVCPKGVQVTTSKILFAKMKKKELQSSPCATQTLRRNGYHGEPRVPPELHC